MKEIFHLSFDISRLSFRASAGIQNSALTLAQMANEKCQMTNGKSNDPKVTEAYLVV